MQNYSTAIDATNTALNSQGSGLRENEQYLQSLEARINKLRNAWVQLSISAGDAVLTDTFVGIVEGLTFVTKGISQVTDNVGLLPIVFGTAALSIVTFSSKSRASLLQLIATITTKNNILSLSTASVHRWSISMTSSTVAARLLTVSVLGLTSALRTLLMATVVGGAFVVLGIVIEKLISNTSKLAQEKKELRKELEKTTDSWMNQKSRVESLLFTYEKLSSITEKTKEQEEEYVKVQNELGDLLPSLIVAIDEKGNKHLKTGDALQRELELTEQLVKIENERKVNDAENNFNNILVEREKLLKNIIEAQEALEKYDRTGRARRPDNNIRINTEDGRLQLEEDIIRWTIQLGDFSDNIQSNVAELSRAFMGTGVDEETSKNIDNLIASIKDIETLEATELFDLSKSIAEIVKQLKQAQNLPPYARWASGTSEQLEKLKKLYPEASDAIDELTKTLLSSNNQIAKSVGDKFSVFDQAGNLLGEISGEMDEAAKSYMNLEAAFDEEGALSHFTGVLIGSKTHLEELNKSFDETHKNIKSLVSAYETLNKGEKLSADTVLELITKYPQLASHLANTNDLTFNKGELIKQVAEIERQARLKEAQNALDAVNNTKKELEDKQRLYSEFYSRMLDAGTIDAWMIGSALTKEEQTRLDNINKQADELRAKITVLNQPLSFFGSSSSKSSSSSSPSSSKDPAEEAYRIAIRNLEHEIFMKEYSAKVQIEKWSELANAHRVYLKKNEDAYQSHLERMKKLENQRDTERLQYTQNYFENRNKAITEFDNKLLQSERFQSQYIEGSEKWLQLEEEQVSILKNKQQALHQENEWIRDRLKLNETVAESEKLTAEQIKFLNDQLKTNSDAWWNADAAIRSNIKSLDDIQKKYQDSIVNSTKEVMSLLEDYYDQQNKLEQKSLDKSLDSYEEYISERKKLLNRSFEEEDFQKERAKLQEEELKLRKKIDLLKLDNSWESISEREDLEEKLQGVLEQIGDLELGRNRKLRENNYDDLLESKRKETETAKEAAETKWQNELQADEHYSTLRQSLLDNNISSMESSLQNFSNNVQFYMNAIGDSIQMNLIDKLDMTKRFEDIASNIPTVPNNTSGSLPLQSKADSAWEEYIENKRKAEEQFKNTGTWNEELRKRNEVLRNLYSFADGSYNELKGKTSPVFSAETGGMTPAWGKGGKFLLAHEKELILNKFDTSNLLKVIDITRGIVDRFKFPDFNPKTPAPAGASEVNYNLEEVNIYVSGNERNAGNRILTSIEESIRRRK